MKRKAAFTLIELLATIGIMAVLMAGATISGRSYQKQTQLRTATDLVKNQIRLARAKAVAPPVGNTGADFGVIIHSDGSVDQTSSAGVIATEKIFQSPVQLAGGANIIIRFSVENQGELIGGAMAFSLVNSSSGASKTINVDKLGNVK